MTRVIGIDYGQRRIGIALSDELQLFATPFYTITDNSNNLEKICYDLIEIIEKEKVSSIVIGLPSHRDGSPSRQTKAVEKFIRTLRQLTDLPIVTYDERYSSVEANELLIRKGISIKKSKEKIDQIAAAIILQNYLNSKEREE